MAEMLLFILVIALCMGVYFVPSIIASKRNHKNFTPILILNIFLGFSLIGWVVALVWATTAQDNGVKK
jgi:hypothetical protein